MLGLTIDTANDDTPMIPSEIKSPNDQTDHEQHSKKKFDYWAEFAKLPRSENEPGSEKYAHGIKMLSLPTSPTQEINPLIASRRNSLNIQTFAEQETRMGFDYFAAFHQFCIDKNGHVCKNKVDEKLGKRPVRDNRVKAPEASKPFGPTLMPPQFIPDRPRTRVLEPPMIPLETLSENEEESLPQQKLQTRAHRVMKPSRLAGRKFVSRLVETEENETYIEDEPYPDIEKNVEIAPHIEIPIEQKGERIDYVQFCDYIAKEKKFYFRQILFAFIKFFFPDDEQEKRYLYFTQLKKLKFPFFIVLITLLQVGIFTFDNVIRSADYNLSSSPLIFDPNNMKKAWTLITYSLLHANFNHISSNLALQLIFGLALEMVHGWKPISLIYLLGAVFGALCHTLFSVHMLVGASGAVCALLFAQIANVFLNFKEMTLILLACRLVGVGATLYDIGNNTYVDLSNSQKGSISHSSHLGGAVIGLAVGLIALKNFKVRFYETIVKWVIVAVCAILLIVAILFYTDKLISQSQ
uniref:Rhomboid domain-containing protein n=1 Tax=Rhabditophanes sp. KR3021 TaxID=114890 RepID=A0AC35U437_9BILA